MKAAFLSLHVSAMILATLVRLYPAFLLIIILDILLSPYPQYPARLMSRMVARCTG